MHKMVVLYYSRTGNTEKMAKAVVEGARSVSGVDVQLSIDFEVTPTDLAGADAVVVGMPTYHHDMTQSTKKVFEDVAVKGVALKGKIGAAFGSYGWSGEAVKLINKALEDAKIKLADQGVKAKYVPDHESLRPCVELGKKIGQAVIETT